MFYAERLRVAIGECDAGGRLSPAGLLRLFQRIAEEHLDWLGFPQKRMFEIGQAFLLNKIDLRILRPPVKGEEVFLWTAPVGTRGARFIREFVLTGTGEERLAEARSWWLLLDLGGRRPLRPSAFPMELLYEESRVTGAAAEPVFPKEPERPLWRLAFDIGYSRLDANGHMNNAAYADLICDALPLEVMMERRITGMTIGYHSEVKAGDRLEVDLCAREDGYRLRGLRGGGLCFEAEVGLEPPDTAAMRRNNRNEKQ